MKPQIKAIAGALLLASQSVYASDLYLAASLGKSEFPFKAFDQVSMPNSEANHPLMYALAVGYRPSNYLAAEVGYYDFGEISSQGCFAAEPVESGGPILYDNYACNIHGSGYAKGYAVSVLPTLPIGKGYVFARAGVIQAKSRWTFVSTPNAGVPNVSYAEDMRGRFPLYGFGFGVGNVRVEYVQSDIQPHGDSAYGKVRAVMLTLLF